MLFEKLGPETLSRINELRREKKIIAVHHQPKGTCLVLDDTSSILLEGLSESDSQKIVGYLGFYGRGPLGLGTPAFFIRPEGYPERT